MMLQSSNAELVHVVAMAIVLKKKHHLYLVCVEQSGILESKKLSSVFQDRLFSQLEASSLANRQLKRELLLLHSSLFNGIHCSEV